MPTSKKIHVSKRFALAGCLSLLLAIPNFSQAQWRPRNHSQAPDKKRHRRFPQLRSFSEPKSIHLRGQRQRLMVARALVNKPRIIFFDEATRALDNETQRTVTDSLDAMQSTRIVIAHRLSTIINADKIYALMNGEMVQSGTYADLINQSGPFSDLAKRQLA